MSAFNHKSGCEVLLVAVVAPDISVLYQVIDGDMYGWNLCLKARHEEFRRKFGREQATALFDALLRRPMICVDTIVEPREEIYAHSSAGVSGFLELARREGERFIFFAECEERCCSGCAAMRLAEEGMES